MTRRLRRTPLVVLPLALVLFLTPASAPVAAQVEVFDLRPTVPGEEIQERADSLFDAWETEAALELLERHLERWPEDWDARWRATRAALVLGVLEEDEEAEVAWFRRAGAHGDIAVELRPQGVDRLYWTAAARGRLALQYGPRTSTELAQQMWDLTERILAIDPDHPGAHNILGKLNHEVEILSGFERLVGRLVLRKPFLSETSWERALRHHRRAVEIDPEVILFRKDLGESLHRSGDPDAARAVLEEALELPERWPVDPRFKKEIRSYLEAHLR